MNYMKRSTVYAMHIYFAGMYGFGMMLSAWQFVRVYACHCMVNNDEGHGPADISDALPLLFCEYYRRENAKLAITISLRSSGCLCAYSRSASSV
jgi:hypothetical protein